MADLSFPPNGNLEGTIKEFQGAIATMRSKIYDVLDQMNAFDAKMELWIRRMNRAGPEPSVLDCLQAAPQSAVRDGLIAIASASLKGRASEAAPAVIVPQTLAPSVNATSSLTDISTIADRDVSASSGFLLSSHSFQNELQKGLGLVLPDQLRQTSVLGGREGHSIAVNAHPKHVLAANTTDHEDYQSHENSLSSGSFLSKGTNHDGQQFRQKLQNGYTNGGVPINVTHYDTPKSYQNGNNKGSFKHKVQLQPLARVKEESIQSQPPDVLTTRMEIRNKELAKEEWIKKLYMQRKIGKQQIAEWIGKRPGGRQ